MKRRAVLVAVLVLSVSLAGCSALPVWGDGNGEATPDGEAPTASPADTSTPTPGGEASTASPTDSSDQTPTSTADVSSEEAPTPDPDTEVGEGPEDVAYPDGYGPSGVADPTAALSTHLDALAGTDGYVFNYDGEVREGGTNRTYTYQQIVDREDGVAYIVRDTEQSSRVSYFEEDRVYIRTESDGDVEYNSSDRSYEMSEFSGVRFVRPLLEDAEYGKATVEETDQGTFYSYASESVTDPAAILRSDVDRSDVDRFDTRIVVDDRGTLRRAAFVAVVGDRTTSVDMSFSKINDTTVERPDWFEEANDS